MTTFRSRAISVVVSLVLASGALAACSSDSGKTVDATLTDFAVGLAPTSIGAGSVTFKVENKGSFIHELVVVQADNAADLPTKTNGEVNEDAMPASKRMGEVEDVNPDSTKSFTLTLPAGKYVLFCNRVDGTKVHFKEGMYAAFTVTS
jgi:uncharacterized cupredoxin-like copper-binding protein